MATLTKRQKEIVDYLDEYIGENGYAPTLEEIGARFGNGPGLPVTYLLDRDGRIRQKFIGQTSRENFEAAIKPLLDETPATAQRIE